VVRGHDVRPNFHWENEALRGSATISIANNPHFEVGVT
jgi:hypothetical protein